jgi:surface antigen
MSECRSALSLSLTVAGIASALLLGAAVAATVGSAKAGQGAAETGLQVTLRPADEIGTLEALHRALTEVGDDSTYLWHSGGGRLTGAIRMTSSFRDGDGKVCRHLIMMLSSGNYTRKAEGIACRHKDGIWSLGG